MRTTGDRRSLTTPPVSVKAPDPARSHAARSAAGRPPVGLPAAGRPAAGRRPAAADQRDAVGARPSGHNGGMIRERLRTGRDRLWRRLLRVGAIRHWYVRRILKVIDRSKAKRRGLSGDLARIDAMTRGMPPAERTRTVERMLEPMGEQQMSRELRRAMERQDRGSGRGGAARRRPGTPAQRLAPQRGKRPR